MPHVIEPAAGADRAMLAFLVDAYDEDEIGGEQRTVLRLHPRLAPVKVAVLPLVRKDGQPELAREIYTAVRSRVQAEYDEGGAIGRRYRRQDEIGTPYCVTVDHQSLEDRTVTAARSRLAGAGARRDRGAERRARGARGGGLAVAEAGLAPSPACAMRRGRALRRVRAGRRRARAGFGALNRAKMGRVRIWSPPTPIPRAWRRPDRHGRDLVARRPKYEGSRLPDRRSRDLVAERPVGWAVRQPGPRDPAQARHTQPIYVRR